MPHQVLIAGEWRDANYNDAFKARNPQTGEELADEFPVSTWKDLDEMLDVAVEVAKTLRDCTGEQIAKFLEAYADNIEGRKDEIAAMAATETGYDKQKRFLDVELVPRTVTQLRQAAAAARDGSWQNATIDSAANIRSYYAPVGPVAVFGPNNFACAFGSISGGDFAAAIAARNPVIAKANSSHPGTAKLFAEEAQKAADATDMPTGIVQMVYRTSHDDGYRLVSDPRIGATAYTGSREAGLKLKAAADKAGKPIYLELSSVNPVVILPGALAERSDAIADEFTTSCLMGTGQFCTNPGLVVLVEGSETEFVKTVTEKFEQTPVGPLHSVNVVSNLNGSMHTLNDTGAELLIGGKPAKGDGYRYENTLLKMTGKQFLADPAAAQTEAFGNSSLLLLAKDVQQVCDIMDRLEGNLTGCIYSDTAGSDDVEYDQVAPRMRTHVGRLLNDKMPTGVLLSEGMNHGGPYPATGHPGFTAVGIPASMVRFAALECFDNVRPHRLPKCLQDESPNGGIMWRRIDGCWSQAAAPKPVPAES